MSEEDYEQRLERAIVEMHVNGVSKLNSRPMYFRILRTLGFKVRPPLYIEPVKLFILDSVYIAVVWAALMWIVQSRSAGSLSISILQMSVFAGLLFGGIMVALNLYQKQKYALTPWEKL